MYHIEWIHLMWNNKVKSLESCQLQHLRWLSVGPWDLSPQTPPDPCWTWTTGTRSQVHCHATLEGNAGTSWKTTKPVPNNYAWLAYTTKISNNAIRTGFFLIFRYRHKMWLGNLGCCSIHLSPQLLEVLDTPNSSAKPLLARQYHNPYK